MELTDYQQFTEQLRQSLEADSRVVGLVAAGSMANLARRDRWSDHDFFVIVESGTQTDFRTNLQWLPDHERIVIAYQETEHGLKVIYDIGHVLEFAVFDMDELSLVKVNDYAVLLDRGNVANVLVDVAQKSTEQTERPDTYYWGQFLAHLIIGVGRYLRGEKTSGHMFVKVYALDDLLPLFVKYLDAPEKSRLDNLDVHRRFEAVFPQIADSLEQVLLLPVPQACLAYLELVKQSLGDVEGFPAQGIQVAQDYITREIESL
ncbi:MAG: hypothetical protein RLP44_13935 [Aggregatilineales bacterium]